MTVLRGYMNTIVCPLRREGYRVDSFVTTYSPISNASLRMLQPTQVTIVPRSNSSNLMSTLASIIGLTWFCTGGNMSYDLVVLTRMDLQLKQPLVQLSAWSTNQGTQKLTFVFKEGRSNWREWGLNSSCDHARWGHTSKRVGDVLHTFDGAVLPCVMRALEHYLFHDPAQGLVTRMPAPLSAQLSRLVPASPCAQ